MRRTMAVAAEVADELNWWYVEWMNNKGWVAETTRTGKIILVFEK